MKDERGRPAVVSTFGETGEQALCREFREELDVEISNIAYLGALEIVVVIRGASPSINLTPTQVCGQRAPRDPRP